MNHKAITNRLLTIEAQAESLRDECRKARRMLEGVVSTAPKKSNSGLDAAQVSRVLGNRKKSLIRGQENLNRANPK